MEEALREAVEGRLGQLAEVCRLERGSQARVWSVRTRSGEDAIVKQSHDAASHAREAEAYARWGPSLDAWLPRCWAALPGLRTLVLERVAGVAASDPSVDMNSLRAAHREAGRFMAALQRVEVEPDAMPLTEAMAKRIEGWLDRAGAFFTAERLTSLRRRFDPKVFAGITRVAAHRDFSPNNWLLGPGPQPRLVVLDFGQARPDAPLVDLLKLWDRPWGEVPGAEAAFFDGYGRALSERERQRLDHLALLHGLATATWGREHDAPEFAALGDAILERLTGPSSQPSWR